LKIENKNHKVITTLSIKFTDQQAKSCLWGNWLRVEVLSVKTDDLHFFPTSEPLSYVVSNNRLTVGRNEICDAYLELGGEITRDTIRGDYYDLGMSGTTPLGFFSLNKK